MTPNVTMLSFWRNDVGRNLTARAVHLLDKTYPELEYLWVVGDSTDSTYEALEGVCASHPNGDAVDILDCGLTPMLEDFPSPRLRAFSRAAQFGLSKLYRDIDEVVIHESDIESPPDIIERLLAVDVDVVGAWPVLGERHVFYDIWAYRGLDGNYFTNHWPYHHSYREDRPFRVESVGTVWCFPAEAVRRGLTCYTLGAVELCRGLREQGYRIWCDPRLTVVQPRALWTPQPFPVEGA